MASWHIHMGLGDCSSVLGLPLDGNSTVETLDGFAQNTDFFGKFEFKAVATKHLVFNNITPC